MLKVGVHGWVNIAFCCCSPLSVSPLFFFFVGALCGPLGYDGDPRFPSIVNALPSVRRWHVYRYLRHEFLCEVRWLSSPRSTHTTSPRFSLWQFALVADKHEGLWH